MGDGYGNNRNEPNHPPPMAAQYERGIKMSYREFNYTNDRYMIFRTIETYSRTASGKNWKSKPDETKNEIIPPEYYTNYITAIPFFNNWGDGAYCRAKHSYNAPGYLPTTIITVSPFQETKKVARFWFYSIEIMELNAGWREKEIIKAARRFNVEYIDGAKMIHLYTNETGVTASGIFDCKSHQWRG